MHIYDQSTSRRRRWCTKINWSRELSFSERQISYIRNNVPDEQGVYCVYAKDYCFEYTSPGWSTARTSPVVYIGSGWLGERLATHLGKKENEVLAEYLSDYDLAYRFDRIEDGYEWDGPKTVEAVLLNLFERKFNDLPPANRRLEAIPELDLEEFALEESENFSALVRG